MYFCHSQKIKEAFPQVVAGVLVFDGIHPQVDADPYIEPLYRRARERLERGPESEMVEIAAWRRAYSQMGLKPTKYRSAAEALLRRFKRENDLPRLHPLVDFCNAISIAFALPVAVFDLAGVDGYIEVRHAKGTEEHLAFSGKLEHPSPDEVILCDAADHAHGRRWTFRQSRRSIVTPETTKVLVICEALHPTATSDVPVVIDTLAEGITTLWSPPLFKTILADKSSRAEF
jgi:DNA/RNA-binding domain of Phe-tRNA-synthetase-like protein